MSPSWSGWDKARGDGMVAASPARIGTRARWLFMVALLWRRTVRGSTAGPCPCRPQVRQSGEDRSEFSGAISGRSTMAGPDVTRLLADAAGGDAGAAEALLPRVYEELRKLARAEL